MKSEILDAIAAKAIGSTMEVYMQGFDKAGNAVNKRETYKVSSVSECNPKKYFRTKSDGVVFGVESLQGIAVDESQALLLAEGGLLYMPEMESAYGYSVCLHLARKVHSEECEGELAAKVAEIEESAKRIVATLNKRLRECKERMSEEWATDPGCDYIMLMDCLRVSRDTESNMPMLRWNESVMDGVQMSMSDVIPLCFIKDGEAVINKSKVMKYLEDTMNAYVDNDYHVVEGRKDDFPLPRCSARWE